MRQPAPTRQSSPPALPFHEPFHATAGEAGRCSASALAQPRHPSSAARRKLQPPPPPPPTTTKRQLRHRSRRLRCREHPRRRTRIGAARDALFGWATLPLSSFVSFLFQSPSNGLITMIAFHFLSGFGLIIADFIMTSIGGQTADTDADLRNFYYLFPAYCLGRGFFSLSTPPARFIAPKPIFSWQMLGGPLVHLFGEGVVFAALTLLLQTLAAYGVTTDSLKPRHLLAAWSFVSVS